MIGRKERKAGKEGKEGGTEGKDGYWVSMDRVKGGNPGGLEN